MSREWKPGDIALLWSHDAKMRVGIKGHGDRWYTQDDIWMAGAVDEARPLVVIDPEDREVAVFLLRVFGEQFASFSPALNKQNVDAMQQALREFADPKPPPIVEPQGLGAVVDCDGEKYVRVNNRKRPWEAEGDGNRVAWDELDRAVRVLSQGVTA